MNNSYYESYEMYIQQQDYYYASDTYNKSILNGPDSESELILSQYSNFSYLYAKNVLKTRFLLAEPLLADSFQGIYYAQDILKSRFNLLEQNLNKKDKYEKISLYTNDKYEKISLYTKLVLNFNHE